MIIVWLILLTLNALLFVTVSGVLWTLLAGAGVLISLYGLFSSIDQ